MKNEIKPDEIRKILKKIECLENYYIEPYNPNNDTHLFIGTKTRNFTDIFINQIIPIMKRYKLAFTISHYDLLGIKCMVWRDTE